MFVFDIFWDLKSFYDCFLDFFRDFFELFFTNNNKNDRS